jgi:hypothetical protein
VDNTKTWYYFFMSRFPSTTPEEPSAPDQAADLYRELGELTTLQGRNYGERHAFGEVAITTPEIIAGYFPATRTDSQSASRIFYASQILDRATGQPITDGLMGIVGFDQKEQRNPNLMYATRVSYRLMGSDGQAMSLERRVSTSEHGSQARLGRVAITAASTPQVDFVEAQQVINVLKKLNGSSPSGKPL